MQFHSIQRAALAASASLLLLSTSASAQSVYGLDGAGSLVLEHTGPPDAVCGYPGGPVLSSFPTPVPFGCPTAATFGPPPGSILGDIATDRFGDTVWVTDGFLATEYLATDLPGVGPGTPVNSYAIGLVTGAPVTGLGWDPGIGALWMTDGFLAWAEAPPAPPGCGAAGTILVPPFVLPTPSGAPATDIEFDPLSGTLFACDMAGFIYNFFPGGAPGIFAPFAASPGPCGLAPTLQGIAFDVVDTLVLGFPVLYVTDGFLIAHIDVFGAPAPPSFHAPAPCFPSAGPLLGLAVAGRALPFGAGADTTGLAAPSIGSIGQTLSPNPAFTTTLTGSVPGSVAGLYLSTTGFNCPPITVLGTLPVYLFPLGLTLGGLAPTDAAGNAVLSTPIPPGIPPGTAFYVQWVVSTPLPSLQVSDGMAVVVNLP